MARFIDKLMREESTEIKRLLLNIPAVITDNVLLYCRNLAHVKPYVELGVLNVRPPFSSMWIEWRTSTRQHNHVGCFVLSGNTENIKADSMARFWFTDKILESVTSEHYLIADFHTDVMYPREWFAMLIPFDEFGQVADRKMRISDKGNNKLIGAEDLEWKTRAESYWVLMYSLTFLNTRNTILIDNPPPLKLSKKHEKRHGVPLVTYKTLKVLPMRKVNANDYDPANDSDTSIPKSLHIARGHFKDYRNGAGLFGKFKDIFWWDAHVRGSAESGVVVKDYDVIAPENT